MSNFHSKNFESNDEKFKNINFILMEKGGGVVNAEGRGVGGPDQGG